MFLDFSPEKKKLTPKRKSLEAPAGDELSPVEKQSSKYPGPSNRMRKTGLPQVVSTSPDGRGLPTSPRRGRPPKDSEGLPKPSPKKRKRLSVTAEQDSVVKKQKLISPDGKIHNYSETRVSPNNCVYSRKSPFDNNKDSNKRPSLEDFKDTKQFRTDKDKKRSHKKKNVVEPGGSQKTLEGWLKLGTFKHKDKSPQDLNSQNNRLADIFKKKTPVKRPAVIEWRGVQLQIKSPRVLLKKNIDISGNLKPRALNLDDKPRASVKVPDVVVTTGKALLADLDNNFRVTRNMVSNVDSVRSPTVDPKSASKAVGTKERSKDKSDSKSRSLLRDLNEDLSEDELTPKSRESLLRGSEKKKQILSKEVSHSFGTQVDDSDLLRTPNSRELRSSGKKRQAVSNLDSKNFWTVSDGTEPLTPTSVIDSNFFPLKGLFDENGNNTPNSKSNSANKNHAEDTVSTPSSSRRIVQIRSKSPYSIAVDKPSGMKAESTDSKNSPVLRSSNKSGSKQEITNNRTSERLVTPRLTKASRSLSDLYVNSDGTANEGQTADNAVDTSNKKGNNDLNGSVNIRKSPLKTDLKSNHTPHNEKSSCSRRIVQIRNKSADRLSADKSSERKAVSADVKNSPVLRSSLAQSVNKQVIISNSDISERTITPKLTKATRCLTDLSFDTANERQLSDNAINTSNEKGSSNLNDSTNITNSPTDSDSAKADIVTMTLQLTPKRGVFVQQNNPPRIQKSRKSLSELKFSKLNENNRGKNKGKAGTDKKMKRNSEINVKTDSVSLKEPGVKDESDAALRKDDDMEIVSSSGLVSSIKPATPSEKKSSKVGSASDKDLDMKQNSLIEESRKLSLKSKHKNFIAKIAENQGLDNKIHIDSKGEDILDMPAMDIHSGMKEIEDKCRAKIGALECFADCKTKGRRKSVRNEAKIKSDNLGFNTKLNSLEKNSSDKAEESISSVSSDSGMKHTKSTAEGRLRSTHRLVEKGKGEEMNFVERLIEKYMLSDQEKEKQAQNMKNSATVSGQDEDHIKSSNDSNSFNLVLPIGETIAEKLVKGGTGQMGNNQSENSAQQAADNKAEVPSKKRRRIVRSFTGEPHHRKSVEDLKKATKDSAGKLENKKNPCENTCPNSQPLVDKVSPRPGATLEDNIPLAVFASMLVNKTANGYPELQGARTVSPGLKAGSGLKASSYYSSLLASVAKDVGKTGASGVGCKNASSPGIKNSGQTNTLLRLKPNVFQEKKKEVSLQTLAEHMDKAANDFHTLSRSSSRSSDDYASTCPVGLSLSPSYVTKFRRSHSETIEEKPTSNKNGSSGIQKGASVLESLESSVIDLTSDKLAMSEYYATEGNKKSEEGLRVDRLDMEDIRPLTDIKI